MRPSTTQITQRMECYRMAYSSTVLKTGTHSVQMQPCLTPHSPVSFSLKTNEKAVHYEQWTISAQILSDRKIIHLAASPSQVPTNKDLRIFSSSVFSRKTKHIDDRSLWLIFCSIEIIFQFLAFPCTVWIDSNNAAVIFFKLRLRIRKVSPHLVWLSWCIHNPGPAGCSCRLELETNRSRSCIITKKASTWLKVPTTRAFTFKTLLRFYANQVLINGK